MGLIAPKCKRIIVRRKIRMCYGELAGKGKRLNRPPVVKVARVERSDEIGLGNDTQYPALRIGNWQMMQPAISHGRDKFGYECIGRNKLHGCSHDVRHHARWLLRNADYAADFSHDSWPTPTGWPGGALHEIRLRHNANELALEIYDGQCLDPVLAQK